MSLIRDIYNRLLKARRPFDFFGDVTGESDLKKKYKDISKQIHPDALTDTKDKYMAGEAFAILSALYAEGKKRTPGKEIWRYGSSKAL